MRKATVCLLPCVKPKVLCTFCSAGMEHLCLLIVYRTHLCTKLHPGGAIALASDSMHKTCKGGRIFYPTAVLLQQCPYLHCFLHCNSFMLQASMHAAVHHPAWASVLHGLTLDPQCL